MSSSARVGLYGGTFDPLHSGHLHLITEILRRNLVDEILIIPAGIPWMREHQPKATPADRLEMVKLGVAELPAEIRARVQVSDIELGRDGPTYTIDTVEELKRENPASHFVLILGSDAFANFAQWHRAEELRTMVEILVIARDGEGLDIDALDASSTLIRTELSSSSNLKVSSAEYLPESIWKFIQERNLYASK